MNLPSKNLSIDSPLAPDAALDRVRKMVADRLLIDTPRYRVQNSSGWVLQEHDGTLTLRLDRWGAKSGYGARFVGAIESDGSGSRIAGRVVIHWLTKIIVIGLSIAFGSAPLLMLVDSVPQVNERVRQAIKAIPIAIGMIAVAVLLARFSVVSTNALIRDGLRCALAGDAGE